MTTSHTPGPWLHIGQGDVVARSDKYCGGEKDIASVFLTRNDEDEANANLIAAAPDLLEALKRLMGGTTTLQDAQEAAQEARAAIAKATGGQA
jgi:hypothetical protein